MKKTKLLYGVSRIITGLVVLIFSVQVFGAGHEGKITKVWAAKDSDGGLQIAMDPPIPQQMGGCPSGGTAIVDTSISSQSEQNRMFAAAMAALMAQKTVQIDTSGCTLGSYPRIFQIVVLRD